MTQAMWTIALAALLMTPGDRQESEALAEFQSRLDAYVALHQQVQVVTTPRLEPMSDTETLYAAREALADGLRRARPQARVGDIFTPAVAQLFRSRLRAIATPEALRAWYHQLYSEGQTPPRRRVTVHAHVPAHEFSSVTPMAVLQVLPELPFDFAYRLVGRDMVLVDVDAQLVIDLLPEALPGVLRP